MHALERGFICLEPSTSAALLNAEMQPERYPLIGEEYSQRFICIGIDDFLYRESKLTRRNCCGYVSVASLIKHREKEAG